MSNLLAQRIETADRGEWERYILAHPNTTFCDRWEWRELIEQVYGLPQFWFVARQGEDIQGAMALTLCRHPILGCYLATAPFANQGGFYADTEIACQVLLAQAVAIQRQVKAKYVVLRHLNGDLPAPQGWVQSPIYATYVLALDADPDLLWREHLRAKSRNQIGASFRSGIDIVFGHMELLTPFWSVISQSMHELGSPYHSQIYLERMLQLHGGRAEFAIVFAPDGRPAGGSLLIHDRDQTIHLHANTLRAYRPLGVGDFLYWSVISECCRRGIERFDMGRSLRGSSNEHFKMKWRPKKVELGYWYHLANDTHLPNLNQANPKLRIASQVWKRLPLKLTQLLGPHLIWGVL